MEKRIAANQFQQVEAEYYRLRGQLAGGRLTQRQFDAALRQLTIHDAQGRYWMVGAESGNWYVHDGSNWVEALPPGAGAAFASPDLLPPTRRSSKMPLAVAGCAAIVFLVGAIALLGAVALGILKINPGGVARATPLPVSGLILPTPAAVLPTAPALSQLPPPPMAEPAVQPTTAPAQATPMPSAQPAETATTLPPVSPSTATAILPQAPATATIAPGLYVSNLRLEPPSPKRREDVAFFPTFLNTTEKEQRYRWLVYIYRVENPTRSFGETPKNLTTIPIGSIEQRAEGAWRLTGGGECENFVARVAWVNENNQSSPFNKPDGTPFELPYSVCP